MAPQHRRRTGGGTCLIETHVPEPLLSSLVLSRLLGVATAVAPALAIDLSPGGPDGGGSIALGDGIVEDPLDRLVLLLQALVEQAEVTERGGGHAVDPELRRRRRRRPACASHRLQLAIDADGRQAVLLTHDAVRLAYVWRKELVQPGLRRG